MTPHTNVVMAIFVLLDLNPLEVTPSALLITSVKMETRLSVMQELSVLSETPSKLNVLTAHLVRSAPTTLWELSTVLLVNSALESISILPLFPIVLPVTTAPRALKNNSNASLALIKTLKIKVLVKLVPSEASA